MKSLRKYQIFNIDNKKLGFTFLVDFVSVFLFLLSIILNLSILSFVIPKNLVPKDAWNLATTQELQLMRDELISFLVVLLAVVILIFMISLFIFTISRKLIWGYLNGKKKLFEGFWKYFFFSTGILIAVSLSAFLMALLIAMFFGYLEYLMSFIPPIVQIFLVVVIPWLVLMYLSMIISYYLHNSYFQNKTDIKKALASLRKLELKKYWKPVLFAAFISWAIHSIAYAILPQSSRTLSLIIIGTYMLQASYLKVIVNSYEKKRLFGIFKRK